MSDEVDMPPTESFSQLKERLKLESLTKADVLAESGGVDLDNLPSVKHKWVKRGVVMSCETPAHPTHRHFLVG